MLKRTCLYVERQNSFSEELAACIQQLTEKYPLDTTVGITFFINAAGDNDFYEKRESIEQACNENLQKLPVSIISQPAGSGVAMEIWTHETCKNLQHKSWCGLKYTIYNDAFGQFIWGLGMLSNNPTLNFREQASSAFERMKTVLSLEEFSFDHLIRQWNYIPGILKTHTENGRLYQNYQLFNDIRQYYYGIYKRNTVYPAATGIGMDCGSVTIDFVAVKLNDNTRVAGLSNPNQINAFNYGQDVLIGSAMKADENKKAPLFERAKYIGAEENAFVFVSGTASITGEKTIGLDDVVEQTRVTIKNISDLTSCDNIRSTGAKIAKKNYTYLRVYVKREDDFNAVGEICKEKYGDIPMLFIKADICRDNLLVEIEGEAAIEP